MSDHPLVSVVIPTLDEEAMIAECLAAIRAQDYPHDRIEVIVVDGGSSDRTRDVGRASLAEAGFARWCVVENSPGDRPSNLNRGLAEARGDVLCRVDARTRLPPDYVRVCVEVLRQRPDVRVVGGAQVAISPGRNAVALGIARALNNRWAMGFARYRRRTDSGPADTVYLGVFRRRDVIEAGGWRPDLPINEDFDLNRRMARHGTVWFDDRLGVEYMPRDSLVALFLQYHRFGLAKVRYWRTAGEGPVRRQWIILTGAPLAVLAGAFTFVLLPGRTRQRAAILALLVAAVVEATGAASPRSGPLGHALALPPMAAISVGWLSGVGTGILAGDRSAGGGGLSRPSMAAEALAGEGRGRPS